MEPSDDTFTLYVGRDKRNPNNYDVGSACCVRVLGMVDADLVHIVHCTSPEAAPYFVRGTPTLVGSDKRMYEGHRALEMCEAFVFEHVAHKGDGATAPAESGTGAREGSVTDEPQSGGLDADDTSSFDQGAKLTDDDLKAFMSRQ